MSGYIPARGREHRNNQRIHTKIFTRQMQMLNDMPCRSADWHGLQGSHFDELSAPPSGLRRLLLHR
jgi:hypothetical protein